MKAATDSDPKRPLFQRPDLAGVIFGAKQLYEFNLHRADWVFSTAQYRVEIWNYTAAKILGKPFQGWGLDAARHIGRSKPTSTESNRLLMSLHPHNAPLQIWLELGSVGVLISLVLLWLVATRLDILPLSSRVSGHALLISTLAVSYVSYGLWQSQWLSTIFSAALLIPLTRQRPV